MWESKILESIASKPILYVCLILKMSMNFFMITFILFSIYYLVHIGNNHVDERHKWIIKRNTCFHIGLWIIGILGVIILYRYRILLYKIGKPIVWAIIFAYLLNPIVNRLVQKNIKRFYAVLIVYIGIFLGLIILSFIITPKIISDSKRLIEVLPQYTKEATQFLNDVYNQLEQMDHHIPQMTSVKVSIIEYLDSVQGRILQWIQDGTKSMFGLFSHVVNMILSIIFTFYFLKDIEYFKKKVIFCIPIGYRCSLLRVFKDIHMLLNKFIRGQLIVASLVGLLSFLALLVIRVNFAFIIGIIAGISNIIPYIGPIIGTIPGAVIALLDTPSKAVGVVIAFTIIQQIESAVITPRIVGESVGLHPVTVIICLLIGGECFGIIGLIFSVPIAASIKIILKHTMDRIVKG